MTKSSTIHMCTVEYMEKHGKIQSADEIPAIEEDILSIVNEKFDEHNAVCNKDEKWKKMDSLNFAQIATVLIHGFDITKINFCEKMNTDDEMKQAGKKFTFKNGNRNMIKRKAFDSWLESIEQI